MTTTGSNGQSATTSGSGGGLAQPPKWGRTRTIVRRLVAGAILVWGLTTVVETPWTDVSPRCGTVVRTGDNGTSARPANETTTTCNLPTPVDSLPFVLIAIIILLPDFSEVGVPGLLTLKRKVDAQEEKAGLLAAQIQTLSNTQNLANQVHSSVNVNLAEFVESVYSKSSTKVTASDEVDGQDERSKLITELQEKVSQLKDARERADSASGPSSVIAKRWSSLYSNEIQQAVGLSVTIRDNPFAVSLDELRVAVDGVERMLSMLPR